MRAERADDKLGRPDAFAARRAGREVGIVIQRGPIGFAIENTLERLEGGPACGRWPIEAIVRRTVCLCHGIVCG
jgi:hypothetical protein